MSQLWQIINLDERTSYGDVGPLMHCLQLGMHGMVAMHITRPCWSSQVLTRVRASIPVFTVDPLIPSSLPSLLRLPPEILDIIFSMIDDVQQAICLCLVDQLMFSVGVRRVLWLHTSMIAGAAGGRIVFLGQHTRPGDYPPNCESAISAWLKAASRRADIPDNLPFFDIALYYCGKEDRWLSKEEQINDDFVYDQTSRKLHKRILVGADATAYRTLLRPAHESEQPWVLCNLTKGMFVRNDVVAALSGPSKPPMFLGHGGLAEIILFRVLWSSCPRTSLAYEGEGAAQLTRGKWAGDRLEITTMGRMRPLGAGREWIDGSREALADMVAIWSSEMGKEWVRKRLQRSKSRIAVRLADTLSW